MNVLVVVVVVVVVEAVNWPGQCEVRAHYDSRFDLLLLIQQSKPALKLFTEGDSTSSLGNEFQRFADLLNR